MIQPIVQTDHPILRETASLVPVDTITAPEIQDLLKDMHDTLAGQADGVALAAPQIAISKRIFVVAPRAYDNNSDAPLIFINPVIIERSKKRSWVEEGCLSVRWLYGRTNRYQNVTVRAYNEQGQLFERGGGGLLAQIFQHEIDHLDGILFHDHAVDIEDLPPAEIERIKNESQ